MFANSLKRMRERNGISQAYLAEKLHVSQGTIGNWETGKRIPDADMLIRIANYFNATVDELLGNESATNQLKDMFNDEDIYRIQRMKQMSTGEEWNKFMQIAKISFEKYFSEDYVDDDTDE